MYVFILEEKNRLSFHDFTSMNFPQSDFAGTSLHGLHQGPCLWSLILDSGILNVFRRRPGLYLQSWKTTLQAICIEAFSYAVAKIPIDHAILPGLMEDHALS